LSELLDLKAANEGLQIYKKIELPEELLLDNPTFMSRVEDLPASAVNYSPLKRKGSGGGGSGSYGSAQKRF